MLSLDAGKTRLLTILSHLQIEVSSIPVKSCNCTSFSTCSVVRLSSFSSLDGASCLDGPACELSFSESDDEVDILAGLGYFLVFALGSFLT